MLELLRVYLSFLLVVPINKLKKGELDLKNERYFMSEEALKKYENKIKLADLKEGLEEIKNNLSLILKTLFILSLSITTLSIVILKLLFK